MNAQEAYQRTLEARVKNSEEEFQTVILRIENAIKLGMMQCGYYNDSKKMDPVVEDRLKEYGYEVEEEKMDDDDYSYLIKWGVN